MSRRRLRFLATEDILRIHRLAILDQGGDPTLRDAGLLDSAIAMPQQQFGGEYLHPDVPTMAAAYAFHIASNHPFVDGNKRAAAAAMIQFLSDNGWAFDATADEAEPVILDLAAGRLDKVRLAEWVGRHVHEKPTLELRDFFAMFSSGADHDWLGAFLAGDKNEKDATLDEAVRAIPVIRHLRDRADALIKSGEVDAARLFFARVSVLIAIFRLAEDMGYEW